MHTVRFARQEGKPIACLLTHPEEYMSARPLQGNLFIEIEKLGLGIRSHNQKDAFLQSVADLH
jgi:hypothetical protein